MEPGWIAVLTSLFGLFSTLVAIWTTVSKRRDEAKHSQAEVADIMADAARDTITMLNERATKEVNARLEAEQRANRLEEQVLELEDSRAGLVHEVQWLREGTQILIGQIMGFGQVPKWDPTKTKPLLTSAQVEKMIAELLAENGLAKRLNETDGKE